jgi:hypothetical protein
MTLTTRNTPNLPLIPGVHKRPLLDCQGHGRGTRSVVAPGTAVAVTVTTDVPVGVPGSGGVLGTPLLAVRLPPPQPVQAVCAGRPEQVKLTEALRFELSVGDACLPPSKQSHMRLCFLYGLSMPLL